MWHQAKEGEFHSRRHTLQVTTTIKQKRKNIKLFAVSEIKKGGLIEACMRMVIPKPVFVQPTTIRIDIEDVPLPTSYLDALKKPKIAPTGWIRVDHYVGKNLWDIPKRHEAVSQINGTHGEATNQDDVDCQCYAPNFESEINSEEYYEEVWAHTPEKREQLGLIAYDVDESSSGEEKVMPVNEVYYCDDHVIKYGPYWYACDEESCARCNADTKRRKHTHDAAKDAQINGSHGEYTGTDDLAHL